ncbi:hypothetical protein K8R43_02890 [archaeon]|nr:hypothetical protein [archaeon]
MKMRFLLLIGLLTLLVGCIEDDATVMDYTIPTSMTSRAAIAQDLSDTFLQEYIAYPYATRYDINIYYQNEHLATIFIPGDLVRAFMENEITSKDLEAGTDVEMYTTKSTAADMGKGDECTQRYHEYIEAYNKLTDKMTAGQGDQAESEHERYKAAKEAYENCVR